VLWVTGSNVSISDLTIVSPFSGTPAASSFNCALLYQGVTNVHAENVTVTGRFYVGISMESVIDGTITDCRVKGVRNRAYYLYLNWEDVSISNCFADGAETGTTPYCDYGFNLNPGGTFLPSRTNITGCTATNMTSQGFAVSERALYTNISNCNAANVTGGPGFLVQRANGFDQTDTNISNCQASSCQIGFYVTESIFVNFTNCIALINTTDGIFISDSDYVGIGNCVSRDNTANGIVLTASGANTVARCTIIGNRCTTNGGTGIVSNANCYGLAVSANVALANTTAQINILGTANQVGNGANIVV
jgi:parallel beta-helix repeat protein